MSTTGLDTFDRTLQVTHIWLDEIMAESGPDRQVAWHILTAVLHALRDRLPLELAVHLGAQLPILVRGAYYDQWHIGVEPEHYRSLEEFLKQVGQGLRGTPPINRTKAVRAVFGVLDRHVTEGQLDKVREALPEQVRMIWNEGALQA